MPSVVLPRCQLYVIICRVPVVAGSPLLSRDHRTGGRASPVRSGEDHRLAWSLALATRTCLLRSVVSNPWDLVDGLGALGRTIHPAVASYRPVVYPKESDWRSI